MTKIIKICKNSFAIFLTIILFASNPYYAYADNAPTTYFGSNLKYTNGVGNLTAWINYSSGAGYWESFITAAANNWMYTGWANPIYITFVSSNYGSNMDFHSNDNNYFINQGAPSGTLAVTRNFLVDDTNVNTSFGGIPTQSWYYAEIHINDDTFMLDTFSNAAAGGTIRHEMGHAFGLAHNNTNPNSIMHQYRIVTSSGYEYRAVQTVQYTDNAAVNSLYGYGN